MNDYHIDKTEVVYMTVRIDDHDYQVPSMVAIKLKELDDTIRKERERHTKEIQRLSKDALKNHDEVADRVIFNLNHGLLPMRTDRRFGGVQRFSTEDSCLAYSISETFGKADSFGNPKFDFHDEVKRRVLLALSGKNVDGTDYID